MVFISTDRILDDAQSIIQDNSTVLRAKLMIWLNILFRKLDMERDWVVLQKINASVSITANVANLPTDFDRLIYAKGTDWFLQPKNWLDDISAYYTDQDVAITVPMGYTIQYNASPNTITFYPGTISSTFELKYKPVVVDGTDSATSTVFTNQFLPILMRGILDFYYEYDADERAAMSYQLDAMELSKLKTWDNRLRPLPQYTGYIRTL